MLNLAIDAKMESPALSGDAVAVDVSVGEGCTTVLATQSSTKVYGPKKITECPAADGVTRQTLRATVGDGALLALNLALGPHVLVMTALVMFTSIQVCLHTCCFGETTKKGAAFTCEPPAVAPPPLPFPASAHCMLHG